MHIHCVSLWARQNLPMIVDCSLRNKWYQWKKQFHMQYNVHSKYTKFTYRVNGQFCKLSTSHFKLSGMLVTFLEYMQENLGHPQGQHSTMQEWLLMDKTPRFPVTWGGNSKENCIRFLEYPQQDWNPAALHGNQLNTTLYFLFSFPYLHSILSPVISENCSQVKYLYPKCLL
jgi:hypothetical protein